MINLFALPYFAMCYMFTPVSFALPYHCGCLNNRGQHHFPDIFIQIEQGSANLIKNPPCIGGVFASFAAKTLL